MPIHNLICSLPFFQLFFVPNCPLFCTSESDNPTHKCSLYKGPACSLFVPASALSYWRYCRVPLGNSGWNFLQSGINADLLKKKEETSFATNTHADFGISVDTNYGILNTEYNKCKSSYRHCHVTWLLVCSGFYPCPLPQHSQSTSRSNSSQYISCSGGGGYDRIDTVTTLTEVTYQPKSLSTYILTDTKGGAEAQKKNRGRFSSNWPLGLD